MTGKLSPKRRKQMARIEKPRLGKVTTTQDGDLTRYKVELNPPRPRKLVINSKPRNR